MFHRFTADASAALAARRFPNSVASNHHATIYGQHLPLMVVVDPVNGSQSCKTRKSPPSSYTHVWSIRQSREGDDNGPFGMTGEQRACCWRATACLPGCCQTGGGRLFHT